MRNQWNIFAAAVVATLATACASSSEVSGQHECGICHAAVPATHAAFPASVASLACASCHATSVGGPAGAAAPLAGGAHANGQVDVEAHGAGWTAVGASLVTPHGVAALYKDPGYPAGLAGCRDCHGADLAAPVIAGVPGCDTCHTSGTAAWRTSCTFCHGDASRAPDGAQLTDAAPPRDAAGNTSSAAVGAHPAHAGPARTGRLSAALACSTCHPVPAAMDPHVDGSVAIALSGPNASGGSYAAATGTCSSTYCHGSGTPAWSAAGSLGCGSCHGNAPATGRHPGAPGAPAAHDFGCVFCHLDVASTGAPGIKATGRALHVNGQTEVTISVDSLTPVTGAWTGAGCSSVACHDSPSTEYGW